MDRSRHIGDPSFYDVPVESIISKKRARELAKTINFKSASSYKSMSPDDFLEESKDTTHYSIVDEDGNAVSNTFTLGIFLWIGCDHSWHRGIDEQSHE